MITHVLFRTWVEHLTAAGAHAATVPEAFAQIVAAYQSPGRFYHNLDHIADVLRMVDELADHARDPTTIRLAAWYHDAVYDARANDNEERSAEMARAALGGLAVTPLLVDRVAQLILATKTHQTGGDPDAVVLLDADVAILGAEPERYDRYADLIRREYAWVPEPAYCAARAPILRRFLDRVTIYRTPSMHTAREDQARANLRRELARLEAAM